MNGGQAIYSDKKRVGKYSSQSEEVNMVEKPNEVEVQGYQRFLVSRDKIVPLDEQLKLKSDFMLPILKQYSHLSSLMDIGASNGYFVFLSNLLGFKKLCLLDHDHDYTEISKKIKEKFNLTNIDILTDKFGKNFGKYDTVLFLALIHWVYSCTSVYGKFDPIIKLLSEMTNNVLIIEWVDAEDAAVKDFKHLNFNKRKIKEEYSEKNFLKSLSKYFNSYTCVGHYQSGTRKVYIAFKDFLDNVNSTITYEVNGRPLQFQYVQPCNLLDEGASKIYFCPEQNLIMKKCKCYLEYGVFDREIFWLKELESLDFVPRLEHVDSEEKIIITSYMGKRINRANVPEDWRKQLENIITILKNHKVKNADLKETEILVNNGKLGIVDFGWASLDGDYSCGIGLPDASAFPHIKELKKENDIFTLIGNKLGE